MAEFLPHDVCNLAVGKPASQSSISQWSTGRTVEDDASIAVSGDATSDAFFHTELESMPWWQVDLLDEFTIWEIRILNRRDQPGRLQRFSVLVALSASPDEWTEIFRKNDDTVIDWDEPFVIKPEADCIARLVRIRLNHNGILHCRQLQVLGHTPSPEISARVRAQIQEQRRATLAERAQIEQTLRNGRNGRICIIGKHIVFVDTDKYSAGIVNSLLAGDYEWRERHVVASVLRPTDRIIEGGTAVGTVTMVAAGIVGAENVLTYDANPAMTEDARRNFVANGLGAITANVGVLCNRARLPSVGAEVDFFLSRDFWGSRLHVAAADSDIAQAVKVPLVCLEDRIAEHRANVLVFDIEGGECDLLIDADLSQIRLIVMETHYWTVGRKKTDDMIRYLVKSGFNINLDFSGQHIVVLEAG